MPIFLLDSNVFIQSANFEYRFSFCNGFWKLLCDLHNNKKIYSIQSVRKELTAKNDDLSEWIKNTLPPDFFLHEREISQQNYGYLMQWAVDNPQFSPLAKEKFASDHADPWLVAYAAARNMTIVTNEVYEPNIKRAIKIPNAAEYLKVNYITPYDFLDRVSHECFEMKY